jgi:hypothetical protein
MAKKRNLYELLSIAVRTACARIQRSIQLSAEAARQFVGENVVIWDELFYVIE